MRARVPLPWLRRRVGGMQVRVASLPLLAKARACAAALTAWSRGRAAGAHRRRFVCFVAWVLCFLLCALVSLLWLIRRVGVMQVHVRVASFPSSRGCDAS